MSNLVLGEVFFELDDAITLKTYPNSVTAEMAAKLLEFEGIEFLFWPLNNLRGTP